MFIFILAAVLNFANAGTASVHWPDHNSKVICGGSADGKDLNFQVVLPDELIRAKSDDERLLIYIDLKRAGRVHVAYAESLTDGDYDRLESILAKLAPEDADFLRTLSPTRQNELFLGFTDGLLDLNFQTKYHHLSLSCQELIGQ